MSAGHAIKIISGGQTGVDRGALDAALANEVPCGGWCPRGRLAEDGPIDVRYPLQETPSSDYLVRTLKNVVDSEATAIIYFGKLSGGTLQTLEYCRQHGKPHFLINAEFTDIEQAGEQLAQFIKKNNVHVLNVAGTRESKQKKASAVSFKIIVAMLALLTDSEA